MRTRIAGWWSLGVLLLLSSCATGEFRNTAATDRLADGMVERLVIARDVAWTKARSGAPVLDPQRETALLAALVTRGKEAGLDRARVERFFVAQIAASREVQTELLAAWAAGGAKRPQTEPLDLRTQIRPRMDAVSAALIAALAEHPAEVTSAQRARIASVLRAHGFSDAVIVRALSGL